MTTPDYSLLLLLTLTLTLPTFGPTLCWAEDTSACTSEGSQPAIGALTFGHALSLEYGTVAAPDRDALSGAYAGCVSTAYQAPIDTGLMICRNFSAQHGFSFTNYGSPKFNPSGNGVKRTFTFSAPQRARQDISLTINDWGCTKDKDCPDSAWNMQTTLLFFPRKVLPAINRTEDGSAYQITLPTGENMLVDAKTKETIGGVLTETTPIDTRLDRHSRKFLGLKYTGRGIMVRSDQRGEEPRSAVVWGIKKIATVSWGDKTCNLSPSELWDQSGMMYSKHATDESFYALLRTKCGWKVSDKDFQ